MPTAAISTPTTPNRRHRPGTARAALSYPAFRILFAGSALSSVGTWMQNFTLPAYLDDRTGSATLVGLLVFMQLGPLMLLSLPAGVLADRVDRTKLVITMQAVMLVTSVLLAIQIAVHAPLWTLFVSQLVVGSANALNAPAFSASLPMLVDRADLPGAVSLNSAMVNGSRVMGPALAALLAMIGLSTAQLFLVNSATFLFLIVPLLFVALPHVAGDHPERDPDALRDHRQGPDDHDERRDTGRAEAAVVVVLLARHRLLLAAPHDSRAGEERIRSRYDNSGDLTSVARAVRCRFRTP